MAYSESLCMEKHKAFEDQLKVHDKRLNNHTDRLDIVEQDGREYKVQIQNLCKQVGDLVTTLRWLMGLAVPSILTIIGLLIRK